MQYISLLGLLERIYAESREGFCFQRKFRKLLLSNLDDNADLRVRLFLGTDAVDENLEDVFVSHVQELGQVRVHSAAFGSSNYIMRPYLKMLAEHRRKVFLMFYKEGYCPSVYRSIHHYEYSLEDIQSIFHGYHVTKYDNYMVVYG